MWDLLGPGIEPLSPALTGEFFTTEPLGNPYLSCWIYWCDVHNSFMLLMFVAFVVTSHLSFISNNDYLFSLICLARGLSVLLISENLLVSLILFCCPFLLHWFFFHKFTQFTFFPDFIGSSPLISSLTWKRTHVPYLNSPFNDVEPQGP